jgi:hypothetical protein
MRGIAGRRGLVVVAMLGALYGSALGPSQHSAHACTCKIASGWGLQLSNVRGVGGGSAVVERARWPDEAFLEYGGTLIVGESSLRLLAR